MPRRTAPRKVVIKKEKEVEVVKVKEVSKDELLPLTGQLNIEDVVFIVNTLIDKGEYSIEKLYPNPTEKEVFKAINDLIHDVDVGLKYLSEGCGWESIKDSLNKLIESSK